MKRSDATAALSWANNTRATDDTRITSTELHVLIVIAGGCRTRAEIAAAVGCAESTVPRCVRKLVKIRALERRAVDGKANEYTVQARQIDTGTIDDTGITTSRTAKNTRLANAPPANDTGADSDTGRAVDNPDTHIRNARARAAPDKNTTQVSEDNPESAEGVERAARAKRQPNSGIPTLDLEMTDSMRKLADEAGFLNGTGEAAFLRWRAHRAKKGKTIFNYAADFHAWILEDLRENNNRGSYAKPSGAPQPATTIRGERISKLTAARRERAAQRDAERQPINLGRVESERIP
jgi:hypothetical protein